MNNNYKSMRAALISGLFVCGCAVAQAQNSPVEVTSIAASSPHASLTSFDSGKESLTETSGASIVQYALLVEQLETDYGPFDIRLSEPLLSTSDILAERGDYDHALNFVERALHIERINQGLYSESQIEIVERLIEYNVAVQDWDAVDGNFRYLQFLYTRLFEQGGLQWDHGIAQVADWHVIAINNNLGDNREEHLREANKLFKLRLVYAEQDENIDEHVINVLRHNVEVTAYHLQKQDEGMKMERVYSRLDSRYRNHRADSLASVD